MYTLYVGYLIVRVILGSMYILYCKCVLINKINL